MAVVASDVLDACRTGLLNDPSGAVYPDAPMYPIINKAYRELQNKLTAYGIGTTKEVTSSPIAVTAGTTRLGDGAGLPADLIIPKDVKERGVGETFWIEMVEKDFEPLNLTNETRLIYWVWREDEIKFPAATTDRQVLIRYIRSLGGVTGSNSPILVLNSTEWLAQRTAAIAALTIGHNATRSNELKADLAELWDDLIVTHVKAKQSRPVRRRRTRFRIR